MSLREWTFDAASNGKFPIGEKKYRESMDSGAATFVEQGSTATRIFLVDWEQRADFIDDVLGFTSQPGGPGTPLMRELPEEHSDYFKFYATEASVQPKGGKTFVDVIDQTSIWPLAKITVTYRPVKWLVRSDKDTRFDGQELNRYVERVPFQAKGDYLTVGGGFKYVSSTSNPKATLSSSPGIIQPSLSIKYGWKQIPAVLPTGSDPNTQMRPPNLAVVQALLGKCNDRTFDGYAAQTVLFVDFEPELVLPKLDEGQYYWHLVYTFEIRDYGPGLFGERAGVNYIYSTLGSDAGGGKYDLVTHDGTETGRRIYRKEDLNLLFR